MTRESGPRLAEPQQVRCEVGRRSRVRSGRGETSPWDGTTRPVQSGQ